MAASATITGDTLTEAKIREGYGRLVIKLTEATFVDGQSFVDVKQDILDNMRGDTDLLTGWELQVRTALRTPAIKRISDTQVEVTLPPAPNYNITGNETVTVTVPSAATDAGSDLVAS